ncbi:hypothetical protein AALA17_03210 [Lactobacillaceae bacterium 24-114]
MNKGTRNLIWTLTAVVMYLFSAWLIKNEMASDIINIMASLILLKQVMRMFNNGTRKVVIWGYVGVAAFLVSILIDLILLSIRL